MEKQASSQEILNLGKKIIAELNLSDSSDTLSRWMVHFLAEKIAAAEILKGDEKDKLEKECFDLILKVWEHRALMPGKIAPLSTLQPVISFLKTLSTGMKEDYFRYFRERRDNHWLKFATDAHLLGEHIISLLIFIQTLPLSLINAKLWKQDHEVHLEKEEIELITELERINEKIDHFYGLTKQEQTPVEMLTSILEKIREILTKFNASHSEFELSAKNALDKPSIPDDTEELDTDKF